MPERSLLIRNALLIDTDPHPVALPGHDLLITGGRIAAAGPSLTASPDAEVLDGTGRIVLPGFVDAHRHTWQTALRGIAAEAGLDDYFRLVIGRLAPRYTPDDVYAGTLAGALEALASGITTLQDYGHVRATPAHADAAVAALRDAGIRAVYGHGHPLTPAGAGGSGAAEVRRLHAAHFAGRPHDDLLTLAVTAAGPSYGPLDAVREDWAVAAELGLRLFTHADAGPVADRPVALLRDEGLLHGGITFAHANRLPDEELALIAGAGAAVVFAPAVEAQMGHGAPVAGRLHRHGITAGLGVDVVTSVAGDMFSLMRDTLLSSRLGPGPRLAPADVLHLATAGGAAALGLAGVTGSLRVGAQADLVLLRATDLNLLGGLHDPVATVVTAAHPGNIDRVLVAGRPVPATPPRGLTEALTASALRLRDVLAPADAF
jgi:cytosine/adenosine deaminase-related metal-dependent hydrolase